MREIDWLFDCYDAPLFYDRNGECLLGDMEVERLSTEISTALQDQLLTWEDMLTRFDVSADSLDLILAEQSNGNNGAVHHFTVPEKGVKQYIYSDAYFQNFKDGVMAAISEAQTEGLDLSQKYPSVPASLLKFLAEQAVSQSEMTEGRFEILMDRVVFIPSDYEASLERKRAAAKENELSMLVKQMQEQGFCLIREDTSRAKPDDLMGEVKAHYGRATASDSDSTLTQLNLDDRTSVALMTSSRLGTAVETVKAVTPQETARVWHARDGTESRAALQNSVKKALEESLSSKFTLLFLSSPTHYEMARIIIDDTIAKLEHEEITQFASLVKERLLATVQLYANGISTIIDATLKQHVEEHLGTYFRREAIPAMIESLREQRLLLDKGRRRDVEKMQQACADATTLTDVHHAVARFLRKQKIESPTREFLQQVKQQTVEQKVKLLKKMSRGSDVLQNLIWLLLAHSSTGLFMSSGKDTTRMIKQYQAVGDADIGRRLEHFRDMLKTGEGEKEVLQAMKDMAVKTVEGSE